MSRLINYPWLCLSQDDKLIRMGVLLGFETVALAASLDEVVGGEASSLAGAGGREEAGL